MKKILAVDDLNGWRNFHKENLEKIYGNDVEIELANSATEAYEIIYNNLKTPFDLIITDLQMETDYEPKFAGEWLVEQIKKLKQFNNSKIIIISASFNAKIIASRLFVNYLLKPNITHDLNTYKTALKKLDF